MWSLYFFNFPPPNPQDDVTHLVHRVEEQRQKTQDLSGRLNQFFRAFEEHIHASPHPSTCATPLAESHS